MKTEAIHQFSNTADTESGPDLEFSDRNLIIRYRDYQSCDKKYKISDVIAFKLNPSSLAEYNGITDLDQCEVIDSGLIKELKNLGEIGNSQVAKHILIGFNESGGQFIDVVYCGTISRISG